MEIVRNKNHIINYLKDFENKKLKKPCRCEKCGRKSRLIWHAKYVRKIITLFGVYNLPVKRLMCPLCKHTFALLPEFIQKFHRYAKDFIAFALEKLRKFAFSEVMGKLDKFMEDAAISPITLYKWKNKPCFNSS